MRRGRKRNRRSRTPAPLRVPLGAHLQKPLKVPMPCSDPTKTLLPAPPKAARDVIAALMAATGMEIAARPDAKVTLLPAAPTTVLISAAGQPTAVFILPLTQAEAQKLLGLPVAEPRNDLLDRLFEEERLEDARWPDSIVDDHRASAWELEDYHAC